MDITTNSVYTNVNGYVISEFNHLNNGKIFRVYTDKFGLISIYSKNIESYFSLYSKYDFKLVRGNDFFYCNEFELLDYNFFKDKKYILFLNILTEIILNSSIQEIENEDIFNLISDCLTNYKKFENNSVLIYFILKYMMYSGYHIIFDDIDSKNYNFNIMDLEIKNLTTNIFDRRYNYKLDFNEYKFILELNEIKNLNVDKFNYSVDYSRLLGIFINALCLNFNIYKLNTFGLFN